jgi:hypothetical protein
LQLDCESVLIQILNHMSSEETAKVKCVILEERRLAIQIEQKQGRNSKIVVWIPRSQIQHVSRQKGYPTTIELPEWLAEEKGLNYE